MQEMSSPVLYAGGKDYARNTNFSCMATSGADLRPLVALLGKEPMQALTLYRISSSSPASVKQACVSITLHSIAPFAQVRVMWWWVRRTGRFAYTASAR